MKSPIVVLFIFCMIGVSSLPAVASSSEGSENRKENIVSFRIPDAFFSSYFFSFERLLTGGHAAMLEAGRIGSYTLPLTVGGQGAKWKTHQGFGIALHYRYHFTEALNGLFLGAFIKYGKVSGTILSSSGSDVLFSTTAGQPPVGFISTHWVLGINIGYRFIWYPGIALTFRLGAGGVLSDSYRYDTEEFQANRQAFAATFNNFQRFDAEVSIGYAF